MISKVRPSILYFSLVFAGYLLTVFVPGFRTGMFAAVLMVAIFLETGLHLIKSDNKSDFISLLNISVVMYFVYNLFSFIWIVLNGFPLSVYVEEFSNSILPIVFYFAAVCIYEKNTDLLYKAFLYSFIVLSVVCIALYITAPQFYCDFLYNMSLISKADASTCRVRMEGVTGSTSLSYLGVAAMLVAAKYVYKYINLRKGNNTESNIVNIGDAYAKRNVNKLIVLYCLAFFFSLAVVFLANGRAGMVAALLVIVYINFLVFFTFKFLDKKYFYIEVAVVVVLIVAMCVATPGIAAKIWARLISLPGAIGQRSEQWVAAINNMPGQWYGQWFGNGLGANGHKAIHVEGAFPVPDGGLVKLYCEEGAIGFALFVYIMIVLFRNGIKNLKNCFCELGIIGTALLMSIGSNIIAFQLCMPIFWLAGGVLASEASNMNALRRDGTEAEGEVAIPQLGVLASEASNREGE